MIAGISIAVGLLLTLGVLGTLIIIYCIPDEQKKIEINNKTHYKYDMHEDNVI